MFIGIAEKICVLFGSKGISRDLIVKEKKFYSGSVIILLFMISGFPNFIRTTILK